MSAIELLAAKDAITTLMARRVYALDTQDWDTYAACHAPDHVSHALAGGPHVGRDAMMQGTRQALEGVRSIHHVHSPEIMILSPEEARGRWAMEDRLYWMQGDEEHWLHGWGYYHDGYGVRDGQWLFTSREVTRQRVEHSPGSRRAP